MTSLTRREREFAEREALILKNARLLLAEHGYLGLNLDRLAEAVEYSKGTLYQHFQTKEDIILAIAAESHALRARLFERAEQFDGLSRERVLVVGVADDIITAQFPDHFQVSHMLKSPSIWEKTSPERRTLLATMEGKCFGAVERVVRGGIEAGDLALDKAHTADVVFGLMTMALGTHLASNFKWLERVGIHNPRALMRSNQHRLLDGWNWRPLEKDWDYQKTERRIRTELFAEECREIAAQS